MSRSSWFYALLGAVVCCAATASRAHAQTQPKPSTSASSFGVNMSGAEFGADKLPGVVYHDYTWPNDKELDYLQSKGCRLIRLPILWERFQQKLGGALAEDKMSELTGVLAACSARGINVLLDCHSYGRYNGQIIGTPEVTVANFGDFWGKMATRLQGQPAMWAFGLMNEPHDMGDAQRWPNAAQAATDAIRATGAKQWVFVGGDGWSGAHSWRDNNEHLAIHDPQSRIVYEAHQYFDADSSGTYKHSYDEEKATPTTGTEKLEPFAAWLKEKKQRGFVGEFGAPNNDRRWHAVLQNFVDAMHKDGIGGTYWAGGGWWGDYALSIEPQDDFQTDRPAMKVLAPLFDGATPKRSTP